MSPASFRNISKGKAMIFTVCLPPGGVRFFVLFNEPYEIGIGTCQENFRLQVEVGRMYPYLPIRGPDSMVRSTVDHIKP